MAYWPLRIIAHTSRYSNIWSCIRLLIHLFQYCGISDGISSPESQTKHLPLGTSTCQLPAFRWSTAALDMSYCQAEILWRFSGNWPTMAQKLTPIVTVLKMSNFARLAHEERRLPNSLEETSKVLWCLCYCEKQKQEQASWKQLDRKKMPSPHSHSLMNKWRHLNIKSDAKLF